MNTIPLGGVGGGGAPQSGSSCAWPHPGAAPHALTLEVIRRRTIPRMVGRMASPCGQGRGVCEPVSPVVKVECFAALLACAFATEGAYAPVTRRCRTSMRRPSMSPALDVFEAIHTARMLRVLKPDPVPDALIERILEAAICAPSAGNAQTWSFIAVTDETQRRRLGDAYRRASESVREFSVAQARPAHMSDAGLL